MDRKRGQDYTRRIMSGIKKIKSDKQNVKDAAETVFRHINGNDEAAEKLLKVLRELMDQGNKPQ